MDIDYKLISSFLMADQKRIKTATRNTLNDVAFIAQKEMTERASKDMKFTKNAKYALGFRVKKANYGKLEAEVYTNRGWLYYHIEKGKRHATSGLKFRGASYIVVPVLKIAFTKKKKMKKTFARGAYIVPHRGEALMFCRARKSDKKATLIAVLKKQVKYHEDTKLDKVVRKALEEHGTKILTKQLNYRR